MRFRLNTAVSGARSGPRVRSVGHALLVYCKGEPDPQVMTFTRGLAHDPQHQVVVVDLPPGADRREWEAVPKALPDRPGGVRLVFSRGMPRQARVLGQAVADRLGSVALVPDGVVRSIPQGGLFVPHGNGVGWLRYRPQRAAAYDSRRFPKPTWEYAVADRPWSAAPHAVVEPTSSGIWLRSHSPDTDGGGHWLVDRIASSTEVLTVVVGSPGGPPVELADALRVWHSVLPSARRRLRFVQLGPVTLPNGVDSLGQGLADGIGEQAVFYTGLPAPSHAGANSPRIEVPSRDGSAAWRPFAGEIVYSPATGAAAPPPELLGIRSPVTHLPDPAGRVFPYGHGTVLEIVQSGLWLRPPAEPTEGDRVRRITAAPGRAVILYDRGAAEGSETLRGLAEDMLRQLDPALRDAFRVAPADAPGAALGWGEHAWWASQPSTRGEGSYSLGVARDLLDDPDTRDCPGIRSPIATGGPAGRQHDSTADGGVSTHMQTSADVAGSTITRTGGAFAAAPTPQPYDPPPASAAGTPADSAEVRPAAAGAGNGAPVPRRQEIPGGAPDRDSSVEPPVRQPPSAPPGQGGPPTPVPAGRPPTPSPGTGGVRPGEAGHTGDGQPGVSRAGQPGPFGSAGISLLSAPAPSAPDGSRAAPPPERAQTVPHGRSEPAESSSREGRFAPPPPSDPAGPPRQIQPTAPSAPPAPASPHRTTEGAPPVAAPAPPPATTAAGTDSVSAPQSRAPSAPAPLPIGIRLVSSDDRSGVPSAATPDAGGGTAPPSAPSAAAPSGGSGASGSMAPGSAAARQPTPGVRVEPVPAPGATAVPTAAGAEKERAWLRKTFNAQFSALSGSVSRVLSESPGLRSVSREATADSMTDFVAVRLYLGGDRRQVDAAVRGATVGPHVPLARCVTSGLRRLPSYRGPALLHARARAEELAWFKEGRVLTEWSFCTASTEPYQVPEGYAIFLIWSMTARRTRLLDPAHAHRVVFEPGTRFKVLPPEPDEPTLVLLREASAAEGAEPGSAPGGRSAPLDGLARSGLLKTLRQLRDARTAASSETEETAGPPAEAPPGLLPPHAVHGRHSTSPASPSKGAHE
ncbi:hypothetical protein RVR_2447 [Actinacidiphila reveromycinica]|uniref:Uncharacterized protein n=1 Tax=Actinacidiphila reveromycinica TaxID=659352 RepID=A0A7U3UQM1_9ACTN|nr:hypothetical protein [Streptomyces sp. SN-593]BBA96923.1 hypothetical protein RVR_2447 [Streptomyces sp. SN-593]